MNLLFFSLSSRAETGVDRVMDIQPRKEFGVLFGVEVEEQAFLGVGGSL